MESSAEGIVWPSFYRREWSSDREAVAGFWQKSRNGAAAQCSAGLRRDSRDFSPSPLSPPYGIAGKKDEAYKLCFQKQRIAYAYSSLFCSGCLSSFGEVHGKGGTMIEREDCERGSDSCNCIRTKAAKAKTGAIISCVILVLVGLPNSEMLVESSLYGWK
ncbi:hypothetical protein MA16_Dca004532 [Dendrobium catenatum]|uniref:Uncharacterized protein n=1 Tax=Dendrobium catenatum TaxID=906689 RepID=A0A2I0W7R8_9ASPA|nr:hypothetical protein MA16_Dca004532 [Dendrobium catenatum]